MRMLFSHVNLETQLDFKPHFGYFTVPLGAVAQLGEHHVRNVGVGGSIPLCSTINGPVTED